MTVYAPVIPLPVSTHDDLLPVVGQWTEQVLPMLTALAQENDTVLLHGPTGAGKSRLAQWMHARSENSNGAFEVVDLNTVPETMQLGTLFGWRRGAFTGAVNDNEGSIYRTRSGTLFIDEIDKLSLKAQAGLLNLLDGRSYRPLGSSGGPVKATSRFIVGTNQNLLALVRQGKFREDLYYRINVIPIRIPSLDERHDEIAGWARFMISRCSANRGGPQGITDDALGLLEARSWPGNLRQLDNAVRRAVVFARQDHTSRVETQHVQSALNLEAAPPPASSNLASDMLSVAEHLLNAIMSSDSETQLSLDDSATLRSLIIALALERCDGIESAFTALGLERHVKQRNHHRTLRRELDRARAFLGRLGVQPDGLPAPLRPQPPS